jgi:hypothetical protein
MLTLPAPLGLPGRGRGAYGAPIRPLGMEAAAQRLQGPRQSPTTGRSVPACVQEPRPRGRGGGSVAAGLMR